MELPSHVLESILERLRLLDLVRAKAVCSSWKSSAEAILSRFAKAPLFFFHSKENTGFVDTNRFMNLEETIVYRLKESTSSVLSSFPCIGSSHGWLIFLDCTTFNPFLLNPFTEVQIHLPPLDPVFVMSDTNLDQLLMSQYQLIMSPYQRANRKFYRPFLKQRLVLKAILTSEPVGEYGVVWMCTVRKKLGFYQNANDSWMELEELSSYGYEDIICCRNQLYALHSYWSASVDIWDLGTCPPTKNIAITANQYPKKSLDKQITGLQTLGYLVESEGEILLVLRFLPNASSFNFKGLHDPDDFKRTKLFHVYKLDAEKEEWIQVEYLGDRTMFVGINHSFSISTKNLQNCKRNSIYFTGNYWIDRDDPYGNDTGIYSLGDEDGILGCVSKIDSMGVKPYCWVFPKCKRSALP